MITSHLLILITIDYDVVCNIFYASTPEKCRRHYLFRLFVLSSKFLFDILLKISTAGFIGTFMKYAIMHSMTAACNISDMCDPSSFCRWLWRVPLTPLSHQWEAAPWQPPQTSATHTPWTRHQPEAQASLPSRWSPWEHHPPPLAPPRAQPGGLPWVARRQPSRPTLLAAFGLFLRLPGYAEVLLKEQKKAQFMLRLMLGVTDDGNGGKPIKTAWTKFTMKVWCKASGWFQVWC